jgi:hypothetical protein
MARIVPIKIVSGGQTGADRAALDAAIALKIPCGGWCPADRRAEDGPISARYPLSPLPGAGYPQRTRKNVADSDGTVIFAFDALTGGSKATAGFCRSLKKPCLVIDAGKTSANEAAILIAVFLLRHRIQILNVAGPRASKQPAIHAFVEDALTRLLTPARKRRRTPAMISGSGVRRRSSNGAKAPRSARRAGFVPV